MSISGDKFRQTSSSRWPSITIEGLFEWATKAVCAQHTTNNAIAFDLFMNNTDQAYFRRRGWNES
ncbi:MAG: hypothetical protein AUI53_05455 [Acidobacteria bacterium 13_1_40CM_2_60_7]|nr:MAG: hypothetical protein AUI53_05455 [Acidobacteria bacterium 13_1_40CM_2_60_7]OLE86932.1 MAG: hypothetical protein AUG07_01810 [Acidobacteria bacterium 13_1_20CM_2_60_10]